MREEASSVSSTVIEQPSALRKGLWFLTGGQVIQLIGDHTLTVAISAYTYGMIGSTWAFALQQMVMFVPWLLFSAIAGPLVDRMDRRKVMITSDVIRGLICLAYPLCRSLEPILLLNFVTSTCRVFGMTARTALIPRLCAKDVLLKVNGIRTSVLGVVDLTIPTLAGVIIAEFGATRAFPFTTFAAIVGASLYALIAPNLGRAGAAADRERPILKTRSTASHADKRNVLREAVAFIKSDKVLFGLVLLYCVYSTGQHGVNAIFYPFLDSVLHEGPAVFGLSVSLYFGSSLAAGLLLAKYGKALSRIHPAVVAIPPMVSWVVHAMVRKVYVTLAASVIEGLAMSILTNLLMTEVQSRAPTDMTGSVWGLTQTLTTACEVCGILAAGAIGERFGPATAYGAVGSVGLVVVSTVVLLSKISVRRQVRRH